MPLFGLLSAIRVYQVSFFAESFECLSDFQLVFLDNASQLAGSAVHATLLLVNYLIFRAFLDPNSKRAERKNTQSDIIDINADNSNTNVEASMISNEYQPY